MTVPKRKLVLKLLSVTLLAILTWVKVSKSSEGGGLNSLTATSTIFVIAWALTMHLTFLVLNTLISWILKLKIDEKKCIIILASQKTLAVAIPVVTFLPNILGESLFSMCVYMCVCVHARMRACVCVDL